MTEPPRLLTGPRMRVWLEQQAPGLLDELDRMDTFKTKILPLITGVQVACNTEIDRTLQLQPGASLPLPAC